MKTPANLAEMAHEETGQWLDSDLLETWVVRRFNRLEQKIRNLESEHEAKVIQNAQLMRERDAYRTAEEHQIALRQKIEQERDALAAHVEAAKDNINAHISFGMASISKPVFIRRMLDWYDATPCASLTRRDAQIKANELKRFIRIYLTPGLAHNRATGELQSLQKQVEGQQ